MTRKVEFIILTSRVIHLQGFFEKQVCNIFPHLRCNHLMMTRRAEFVILCYRVIRLQEKSEKSSMQHIYTLKVKSSNIRYVPYVRLWILLHFRKEYGSFLPAKNCRSLLQSLLKSKVQTNLFNIFFQKLTKFQKNSDF